MRNQWVATFRVPAHPSTTDSGETLFSIFWDVDSNEWTLARVYGEVDFNDKAHLLPNNKADETFAFRVTGSCTEEDILKCQADITTAAVLKVQSSTHVGPNPRGLAARAPHMAKLLREKVRLYTERDRSTATQAQKSRAAAMPQASRA